MLDRILDGLPAQNDPNLLVGISSRDDAGVYLLRDGLALVLSTDFFTPIVDDPYDYGQISAANSLSDVYAMGGRPLTALSILCYPEDGDLGVLERILAGGIDKMSEAGCTIAGGHSVRDSEIKFGYAVTGTIDPGRIWTKAGARPGDRLLLTKPLGTGVITTALRAGAARESWVEAAVVSMRALNRAAAEALSRSGKDVHSVTDVTGFGLIGHAREMAAASGVSLRLQSAAIELLPGAVECAAAGHVAGGLKKNREFVGACARFADGVSAELRLLMYDPQTSGGLLAAVARGSVADAQNALRAAGLPCVQVGEVLEKIDPLISIE